MKLTIVSLLPLELFTLTRAKFLENELLKKNLLKNVTNECSKILKEISGGAATLYAVSPHSYSGMYLTFHESSACLIIEATTDDWKCSKKEIIYELYNRNDIHRRMILNLDGSPAKKIVEEIKLISTASDVFELCLNYVFSFYVLETDFEKDVQVDNLKVLAEPSFVDIDDMMSTECIEPIEFRYTVKDHSLSLLEDIDIANNTVTYITWATIVSVSDSVGANRTKSLLIALECRLQIIWNRCFSVSRFIDNVFDGPEKPNNIDDLYWSFIKTLDDAKSVLSSTFSSRAQRLFSEMIATSKIEGEIERLGQKVNLLDKYIAENNRKKQRKYQKAVELLLFITALASMAQVFFSIPVSFMSTHFELVVMIFIAIAGAASIFKGK